MVIVKRILLLCAVLAFAGVTLTSGTQPAMAQVADAKTKREALNAFKAGKAKFDKGDFEAALADFEEANRIYPGASPKHKIAVCYDKLGKVKDAISAYEIFVNSDPGPKYLKRVKDAKTRIDELKEELAKMPGKVVLTIEPADATGLSITVDGSPAEGTELELEAGEHTIVVEADGMETVNRTIEVEPAETHDVSITLTASEEAPPPPPPEEEESEVDTGLLAGGLVGAGVAVVGFGLMTAFGVMALGAQSDFENANPPTEELADDTEDNALIADVFLGVGAAGAIVAAILIPLAFTSGGGEEEEGAEEAAMPKLQPLVGPAGAGMAATWTF